MTPDEVVKVLEELKELFDIYVIDCGCFENHLETNPCKHEIALSSAISLLQDYQKLRERVSVEKIAYQLFAEEFPQEPWADWTRKPQGAK